MATNYDSWEIEVDAAFSLLTNGDEGAFREWMIKLGFDQEEIERHLRLERAVGSPRPDWPRRGEPW